MSSASQSHASHQQWPLDQLESGAAPRSLQSEDDINLIQSPYKDDGQHQVIRQTVELAVDHEPSGHYAGLPEVEAKATGS